MKTQHIDTTAKPGERFVAFWRLNGSKRIVAALFVRGENDFRYRTDNGGGFISVPNVDVLLGNADEVAIQFIGQRVVESYASAVCYLGAPVYF